MLITTTERLEGHHIKRYLGVVSAESVLGANVLRDVLARVRDVVGGPVRSYEKVLCKAKKRALKALGDNARELGANAVVGVDVEIETLSQREHGGMLVVSASGTAVKLK